MLPVIHRAAPAFLGDEFNGFLFAFVGTDRAGEPLSVISALARQDLDAWAEAAALARLPQDAAIVKLAAVLRRYTEIPQIAQEAGAIAVRLIALLPDRAPVRLPVLQKPRSEAAAVSAALLAFAILFGIMYVYQAHAPATAQTTARTVTDPNSAAPSQAP